MLVVSCERHVEEDAVRSQQFSGFIECRSALAAGADGRLLSWSERFQRFSRAGLSAASLFPEPFGHTNVSIVREHSCLACVAFPKFQAWHFDVVNATVVRHF